VTMGHYRGPRRAQLGAGLGLGSRMAMSDVLDRLDELMPRRAAWLLATWRSSVAPADLETLRTSLLPLELPPEVALLLQWHDGQAEGDGLPAFLGIDSASSMASHVRDRRDLWLEDPADESWLPLLPLCWRGRAMHCLELSGLKRAVVSAGLEETQYGVVAPSLEALLDAVADLVEAGLLAERVSADRWADWHAQARPIIDSCYRRHVTDAWVVGPPWPHFSRWAAETWPPHWRELAEAPD
jgi:hypothetical protein